MKVGWRQDYRSFLSSFRPAYSHSCGAIRPIIEDLIEIGIDVLNPIQCNCPGMHPRELEKELAGVLAFMGGVDTPDVLPNGTVDQVRKATADSSAG